MSKAKYWKGMAAGVIILAVILVAAAGAYMFLKENVKEYEKTAVSYTHLRAHETG